jgi:5-carboxymethyl-2-hydroxymuconate isomerase
MPHFVVEYTDNIAAEARIPELLAKANRVLMDQDGVFPTGGIRSRAYRLTEYAVADQAADYAFVHAELTIGEGRPELVRRKAGDALFAMIKEHFAELFARRPLALSFELYEASTAWSWKHNNLHARLKQP